MRVGHSLQSFGEEDPPVWIEGGIVEAMGKIEVKLDARLLGEGLVGFRIASALQVEANGLVVRVGVVELP